MLDHLWHAITRGMISWYEIKIFIEHASVVSSDALHVVVGVGVWLIVALVSRRSVASWLPWLALLAIILFNELVDLWVEQWPDKAMQYGEGAKDLALTMFLPTVLLLAVRLRPDVFGKARGTKR
jgi:hypothetical protein